MGLGRRSVYEQSGTQLFLYPLVDTTYMNNGIETPYVNKCKLYFSFNGNIASTHILIYIRNSRNNSKQWTNWRASGHSTRLQPNTINSEETVLLLSPGSADTVELYVEITTRLGVYTSNHIYLCLDKDENIYNTINYNGVLWTLENLRTTKFNDGTDITLGSTQSDKTPYYYEYPNPDDTTKSLVSEHPLFGRLYNFPCVETGKLAPTGWRVPSDEEWTNLTDYLGISKAGEYAGTKLIKRVTGIEEQNSVYAWNNASGANRPGDYTQANRGMNMFGSIPAGDFNGSSFRSAVNFAFFWSSTPNVSSAYCRNINYNNINVIRSDPNRYYGFSVRLCRDIGSLPQ